MQNQMWSMSNQLTTFLFVVFILLSMWFLTQGTAHASTSQTTLKIGDYVQFGSYNSKPIVWRVIHIDETGDPVLFSNRILTYKAFDAAGTAYQVIRLDSRKNWGSNFYRDSDIRQWLNSSSPNSGSNLIKWLFNPPTAANLWNGVNPYHDEKGFLADGNFSRTERKIIKPYKHKVIIPTNHITDREGSNSAFLHFKSRISEAKSNYDSAMSHSVTDHVFLLSIKQIYEWVYEQRDILGEKYRITTPPESYILNTPFAEEYSGVYKINEYGEVGQLNAFVGTAGIRPAMQIKRTLVDLTDGAGTSDNPYTAVAISTNQAPTDVRLSESKIQENLPPGTLVGYLNVSDADADDVATIRLVGGAGSTDNGKFTVSGSALISLASFDFEKAQNMSIRVRATDLEGAWIEKVLPIQVTSMDTVAPSIPTGLAVSMVTANSFEVRWKASSDNVAVSGYDVFLDDKFVGNVSKTSYTFTNMKAKTLHSITLQAVDRLKNRSALSQRLTVWTAAPPDLTPPTVPSGLTVIRTSGTSFVLKWTPSKDNVGVTGYLVYVNNQFTKTVTVAQAEVTGLKQLTKYSVQIEAIDAAKRRSPRSRAVTINTTDIQPPTAPTGLTYSERTARGFRVTWKPSIDNGKVTQYLVYRDGNVIASVSGTLRSFNFTGLSRNRLYQIRIQAMDEAGNRSERSATLSVRTLFQ